MRPSGTDSEVMSSGWGHHTRVHPAVAGGAEAEAHTGILGWTKIIIVDNVDQEDVSGINIWVIALGH